jgi:hypothetical protein
MLAEVIDSLIDSASLVAITRSGIRAFRPRPLH